MLVSSLMAWLSSFRFKATPHFHRNPMTQDLITQAQIIQDLTVFAAQRPKLKGLACVLYMAWSLMFRAFTSRDWCTKVWQVCILFAAARAIPPLAAFNLGNWSVKRYKSDQNDISGIARFLNRVAMCLAFLCLLRPVETLNHLHCLTRRTNGLPEAIVGANMAANLMLAVYCREVKDKADFFTIFLSRNFAALLGAMLLRGFALNGMYHFILELTFGPFEWSLMENKWDCPAYNRHYFPEQRHSSTLVRHNGERCVAIAFLAIFAILAFETDCRLPAYGWIPCVGLWMAFCAWIIIG
jgi:hypothetical protein